MKKILLSAALAACFLPLQAEETVYFTEDFEWFDPMVKDYADKDGRHPSDNVGGEFYKGAYNPQSKTIKNADGKTIWDLLVEKGYTMTSTSEAQAKKSVGLAVNYIKMSVTRYTAALTLPKMADLGDGTEDVHIQFDWTPMTDGGQGIWDKTKIAVVVETDGKETIFPVEEIVKQDGMDGSKAIDPYKWYNVDIAFSGIKLNKDSRITLRNADPDFPDCGVDVKKRWFIDNIKVYADNGSSVAEIENEANAPVEYYNMQGIRVANPEKGLYIVKQGNKILKQILK